MLPDPCYVISDAHLGVTTTAAERNLLRFLDHLEGHAASLVINGDLYDFWFEWKSVIPRRGFRVLAALARLVERGTQLLWIAGNHDCWGGDVLRDDVGATYHVGVWRGTVAGWRARIEHGDGLRRVEDRRYRLLRSVLRHAWSVRAFRLVHPDLGTRIALGSSHASRSYRARDGGAGLKAVAQQMLDAEPELELLIFGHTHVPALDAVRRGRVYANAGTWMDDTTYLRISNDAIELRRWTGAPQDELVLRQQRALGEATPATSGA